MQAKATLGPQGFRTEVQIGSHFLISDEPTDKGGTEQGPTAMNLMSAALASCTAATLRFYANLKGFPLEGVDVTVEAVRRTPSEQVEAGPQSKAVLVKKQIVLKGDQLTPEQRERMLAVAEKCPVNRALLEGVDMLKA